MGAPKSAEVRHRSSRLGKQHSLEPGDVTEPPGRLPARPPSIWLPITPARSRPWGGTRD